MTTPTEIRALIERAAKAVGREMDLPWNNHYGNPGHDFHPLHSAEDCETLKVMLRIDVDWYGNYVRAIRWDRGLDPHSASEKFPPNATPEQKRDAMRMAVLRVAGAE